MSAILTLNTIFIHFIPPFFFILCTEQFAGNRIANPVNKLTVFIIRNFCLIHVERLNRHHPCPLSKRIWNILVALSHMKTPNGTIKHAIWICKKPRVSPLNTYKFSVITLIARTDCQCKQPKEKELFHSFYFTFHLPILIINERRETLF